MKVMTLLGTRPELIKMSRVIAEFDANVDHILVHSGQNFDYELNQIFFEELEIRRPDYFLHVRGDTPAQAIAQIIERADVIFAKEQPQALLLYGDTNTCLAVIAAKRRKIPVFHMEAGNRCFDQRVPEELNRTVLDHLSDINLVLTEHARRYLLAEGIRPDTIFKTGSHMEEVLAYYAPKIAMSKAIERLEVLPGQFFVVSLHREENVDSEEALRCILQTLTDLASRYCLPVLVSTHPRTRARLNALGTADANPLIRFLKPFGFFDYIHLQQNAFCVLSDSGTVTEESSLLHFPAVTVRNTHERPEGMDAGTLVMSGLKSEDVLESVQIVTGQHHDKHWVPDTVPDYRGGAVSKQVLRLVFSYVGYVNRTVWRKH